MYIHAAILSDLHDFMRPADFDDWELARLVQLLERTATLSVPSLLGWRLQLQADAEPLVLTSVRHGNVAASLKVPLGAVSRSWAEDSLTLFAGQPGAFTSLAADTAAALHVPDHQFRLDEDLQQSMHPGITGLGDRSAINQALGVLVDRGNTVPTARAQLQQEATLTDLTVYRTARSLISNF